MADAGWERAYGAFLDRGKVPAALRCAFWLAFGYFNRGDQARGGGWMARARRLLDDGQLDCVEQGYLLVPMALSALAEGDAAAAAAGFDEAASNGTTSRRKAKTMP